MHKKNKICLNTKIKTKNDNEKRNLSMSEKISLEMRHISCLTAVVATGNNKGLEFSYLKQHNY